MKDYVLLGAQWSLATVFALAVITKVRSAAGFRAYRTTVRTLTKLSERTALGVAVGVLACEAGAVLLLALPVMPLAGLLLAAGLLLVFMGAVFRAVRKGVFAECGCFGDRSSVLSYPLLVRNALLLMVAMMGLALESSAASGDVEALPAGIAVAVGLALGTGFVRYYDVLVTKVLMRVDPTAGGGAASAGARAADAK
ncbi:MauE/DoxX family redox-associated membrane protein [Actinomadura rudentiformis]|uniref:Methylamine utilisation protein MauE domain-containing protein n=1 Tax=Actinomadura rudentiformis TaxID=359158 RepID=A0A6H9Z7W7_9ACTN|nr:MauE/DoxX family redox-associated membrane protein [Actinomadura rudentiformis]KAB2352446.1 hypothetical protein F8566_01815 [Actinomadura rudentiformis]